MSGKCIASHVPGRLRMRHADLRPAAANAAAAAMLAATDGITAAEGNPACASIVLRYDPARIAPAEVELRVRAMLGVTGEEQMAGTEEAASPSSSSPSSSSPSPAPNGGSPLWRLNRPAKLGMLAALAGTLLALTVNKKMHAAFGAMHVAFLLVHLANHRKKILQ